MAEEDFAEIVSLDRETPQALFRGDKGNFASLEERVDAYMLSAHCRATGCGCFTRMSMAG